MFDPSSHDASSHDVIAWAALSCNESGKNVALNTLPCLHMLCIQVYVYIYLYMHAYTCLYLYMYTYTCTHLGCIQVTSVPYLAKAMISPKPRSVIDTPIQTKEYAYHSSSSKLIFRLYKSKYSVNSKW